MGKRSFFYKGPKIYKTGLILLHGKKIDERYTYISSQVGFEKTVLEPACGPGILASFLFPDTTYRGFDINEKFVNYAKERNLDVYFGDATNQNSYCLADVVVLCHALHHLGEENEKEVIKYCSESAKKKLIVCEPFRDYYLQTFPELIPGKDAFLKKWFNYIKRDGINKVTFENIRTKNELENMMNEGFNIIPNDVKKDLKNIEDELVITYHLN